MNSVYNYIKEEIEKIERQIVGKEIIVFGAGSRMEKICEFWDFKDRITFFVDNNESLWGEKLMEKSIVSPTELFQTNNENIVLFLLCPYRDSIYKQLENAKFSCLVIDILEIYELYTLLYNHIIYTQHFQDFLENIPKAYFSDIKPGLSSEVIGIVIEPAWVGSWCYYSIMTGLLLMYRGYKVIFVIDDLHGVWDYVIYDGITEIFNEITKDVLNYINKKIVAIDTCYLSSVPVLEGEQVDYTLINELAKKMTIWLKSIKGFKTRDRETLLVTKELGNIMGKSAQIIRCFFEYQKLDVINLYTGLYSDAGLFAYIAYQLNIRCTSYDSDGKNNGRLFFSRNGIVGKFSEISQLIEDNVFDMNLELKRQIIKAAKLELEQQRTGTKESVKNSEQLVDTDEYNEKIDVLIALNIEWDAAALAADSIFGSMQEWLIETIEYLLNNTNTRIMVREHPAKVNCKQFKYYDYNDILKKQFGNNERLIHVRAEDPVNTYKQMQKCKLVLVFTSTVGMEAVLTDKPVVLCTDAYYHIAIPNLCAYSKKEYFDKIDSILTKGYIYTKEERNNMLLAYELHKYIGKNTEFGEVQLDWMKKTFYEINNFAIVNNIVATIAENQSYIYQNICEQYDRGNIIDNKKEW